MALDFKAASRRTVLATAVIAGAALFGGGWGPASAQTTGAATSTGQCDAIRDDRKAIRCMNDEMQQRIKTNNERAATAAAHAACTRSLMSWASEDEKKKASRIAIVQDLARADGITDLANVDTCALRDKAKARELQLQGRVTPGVPAAAPVALQVQ